MKIAGTDFDLNNNALWIYISGCKPPHCGNCQNKSLWGFDVGRGWELWRQKLQQNGQASITKRYFVAGGEPLDQNNSQLEQLLDFLSQQEPEIWLWTRYQLEDIPKNILQYCDYIKTGEYIKNLESYEEPLFGIELASTNQRIIKVKTP